MTVDWTLCDPRKRLPGWDLSKWQGKGSDIDWDAGAKLGVSWVVAKAFSGARFEAGCKEQLDAAKAAQMLTGIYAWWYPALSDQTQVDAWTQDLSWVTGFEVSFTIDVEEVNTAGFGHEALRDRLYFLTSTLYSRLGLQASIYTGDWYWRSALGDVADDRFCGNPNWHAAYPSKKSVKLDYERAFNEVCSGIAPRLAAPWRAHNIEPWAWQFDGDGGLYLPQKNGAQNVDVDVNLASVDAIASMVGVRAMERVREQIEYALSLAA